MRSSDFVQPEGRARPGGRIGDGRARWRHFARALTGFPSAARNASMVSSFLRALVFGVAGLGAACSSKSAPDASEKAGASCEPKVRLSNVAFYGAATPSAGASLCTKTTPPVASVLNAPYAVTPGSGAVNFGAAAYRWVTYTGQAAGGVAPTVTVDASTGVLSFAGHTAQASDGTPGLLLLGLAFDSGNCLDVSGYAGVTFDLEGVVDGCSIDFFMDDSEDTATIYDGTRGACVGSDCSTAKTHLETTGTLSVPFSEFAGGVPEDRVDTASVVSMQWIFNTEP